jgi:hypothetical protein
VDTVLMKIDVDANTVLMKIDVDANTVLMKIDVDANTVLMKIDVDADTIRMNRLRKKGQHIRRIPGCEKKGNTLSDRDGCMIRERCEHDPDEDTR